MFCFAAGELKSFSITYSSLNCLSVGKDGWSSLLVGIRCRTALKEKVINTL